MMRKEELREFSAENQIPFRQVLGWYVSGLLLHLISETGFLERMIIVSPVSLNPDQDLHILEEGIRAYYLPNQEYASERNFVPGCPYRADFRERLLLMLQREAMKAGYPLEIRVIARDRRVGIYYDQMYVPLDVIIEENQIDGGQEIRTEEEVEYFDPEIKAIRLFSLSPAMRSAILVKNILERLELDSEMEDYLYLNDILTKETVSAREACWAIRDLTGAKSAGLDEAFKQLKTYDKNSYMKRKWKVLLRRHGQREPVWEKVIGLVVRFIEPVIGSLENDQPFFGEWMPELGRYLE